MVFFFLYPQGDQQAKKDFNLSWLRVRMSYHRYNNLAVLIKGDLAAKIGQGILSNDFVGRECNCSLSYKFNIRCVCKGKCQNKCLIYEVKFFMCDANYIGNTQQKLKKIMDGHFSNILFILKNIQNQIHLLPIFSSTVTLLQHINIYISILR